MKFAATSGLAVVALMAVCMPASAEIVGESFLGPGGTGHEGLMSGFSSNLIEPILDFTSNDYIDITIVLDAATTFDINEAPSFGSVINDTGLAWSGFGLENENPDLGRFNDDWLEADASLYFKLWATSDTNVGFSNLFGGPGVSDGEMFALSGHYSTTGAGTVTIREFPTAVPEPKSSVLMVFGTAGIGLIEHRQKNAAVEFDAA